MEEIAVEEMLRVNTVLIAVARVIQDINMSLYFFQISCCSYFLCMLGVLDIKNCIEPCVLAHLRRFFQQINKTMGIINKAERLQPLSASKGFLLCLKETKIVIQILLNFVNRQATKSHAKQNSKQHSKQHTNQQLNHMLSNTLGNMLSEILTTGLPTC